MVSYFSFLTKILKYKKILSDITGQANVNNLSHYRLKWSPFCIVHNPQCKMVTTLIGGVTSFFSRTHSHVLFWGHWCPVLDFWWFTLGFKTSVSSTLFRQVKRSGIHLTKESHCLPIYNSRLWGSDKSLEC